MLRNKVFRNPSETLESRPEKQNELRAGTEWTKEKDNGSTFRAGVRATLPTGWQASVQPVVK